MYPLASATINIFLVDDYQPVLWGLAKLIQGEYPRMLVVGAASTRSATMMGVSQRHPDVVLLDYRLGDEDSLHFLAQLALLGKHRILMLTGQQYSSALTRKAMALGACAVLPKDTPATLLLQAIENVHCAGCWTGQSSLI